MSTGQGFPDTVLIFSVEFIYFHPWAESASRIFGIEMELSGQWSECSGGECYYDWLHYTPQSSLYPAKVGPLES